MTRIRRGPDTPLVISCKAPRRLTDIIERTVSEHPMAFKNKSDFLRKAILHFLKHIGAIKGNRIRRLKRETQTIYDLHDELIEETFSTDREER